MTTLTGRLLVSTPALTEANFDRTVIAVLEHARDGGALGVVLNRPSEVQVDEPVPGWGELAAPPGVVFVGGPVQPTAAIALGWCRSGGATADGPASTSAREAVMEGVVAVDLDDDPVLGGAHLRGVRIFAGYAGWSAGQLEDEMAEGAWFVVDGDAGDVFTDDTEGLWRRVLGRQDGPLSRLRFFPDDLRTN